MSTPDLKIEELKLDHVKTLTTFFLAIIGGELASVQTLFASSPHKWLALLSIVFLTLGCMVCLSISEGIIRRISPRPTSRHVQRFSQLRIFSSSTDSEWMRATLGAILLAFGLATFIFFVYLSFEN